MADDGYLGHDVTTLTDPNTGQKYFTCKRCGMDSALLKEFEITPTCTGRPRH